MTQTTCPRCDCTTLQYEENYGYWECLDCGHVWALNADDPDYEKECLECNWDLLQYQPITDDWKCLDCGKIHKSYIGNSDPFHDANLCAKCNGGGLIQEDGELLCCQSCSGSGSTSYG
ncbi:hypothetical protein [Nostoc sp.]|uniref:hypothetical protein n=1 Tax=Nostoc sp. TaxID=1180 RepID=UPI002FFC3617